MLATVILVSVVSAQTFFSTDRRSYRTSNNFRRQNGNGSNGSNGNGNGANGANGDAAAGGVTQVKEPADTPASGGFVPQVQTQLSDGEY